MEKTTITSECVDSKYRNVAQLYEVEKHSGQEQPIYPQTVTQAIHNAKTGASLEAILAQYNNVFLQYMGSGYATRNLLPMEMRRKGIQISYRNMDDDVICEKCVNDTQRDNENWGLDANWERIDNLSLSGDISVSSKGTWVIEGKDTGINAVGPKGSNGLTPWIKTIDNKLYYSYDNVKWVEASDYLAAYFRWNEDRIQISRDKKTWTDLSTGFTNDIHIKGYVANTGSLPVDAKQGDMYMVGTGAPYNLYIYNDGQWKDNGQFTGLTAGVVNEIGSSETEVMSQKSVCNIIGLSEYPAFSESEDYAVGDVVNKDGKLYEFTAEHAAGAWLGTDAEETSVKKELERKDAELETQNTKYRNIFIKGISDALVKKTINGELKTLVDDEKVNAINIFNSLITKVESINYDGYVTFALISIQKSYMYISMYLYDSPEQIYTQEDFPLNNKHNVEISYSDIKDGIIYYNLYYSSSCFRIYLDERYKSIVEGLQDGERFEYVASSCATISYKECGFKPEDVTNPIFKKGGSHLTTYDSPQSLFAINDAVLSFTGEVDSMYVFNQFALTDSSVNIKLIRADVNEDYTFAEGDYTSTIQFFRKISPDFLNRINSIDITGAYEKNKVSLVLDFTKLFTGINVSNTGYSGKKAYLISKDKYSSVYPYFSFAGYYSDSARRVNDSSYHTAVIPLNQECSIMRILGSFDKNANILLCDINGVPKKWGILNEDGSRYSGDTTISFAELDVRGFKYAAVSTKGNTGNLSISIKDYTIKDNINSFNTGRIVNDGKPHNIHLFNSIFSNNDVYASNVKSVSNMQALTQEVTYSFEDKGDTYNENCLLEVGHYTNTRYFCALTSNKGYNAILWKEKDGVKTKILKAGDTVPVSDDYPYTLIWGMAGANSTEQVTSFIKELSNGELLIGLKCRFPDSIFRYVIFKTKDNQSVFVPKIVTSNEHYFNDSLGYNTSVIGYPTKNNSICIFNTNLYGGRKIILLSEYGVGVPKYWYEQGISVNGLGISGKMWISCDEGVKFKKIFDFDEKINGVADDLSDNNWKWCTSYKGRMTTHIHSCYIDDVNQMIWMTNGDSAREDGKNSLYYAHLGDIISWWVNYGEVVDPTDIDVKYKDNEALPEFYEYKMWEIASEHGVSQYDNCLSTRVTYQMYTFLATNNALLLGGDITRQPIFGIHSDCINRTRGQESPNLFIDIFWEKDKDNPVTSGTIYFPQQLFRKDENSLILALWSDNKIYGSWDGVTWGLYSGNIPVGFTSYILKDLDGKYISVSPADFKQTKLLDY